MYFSCLVSSECLLVSRHRTHRRVVVTHGERAEPGIRGENLNVFFVLLLSVGLSWSSLVEQSGNNQIVHAVEIRSQSNRIETNHVDG